MGSGAARLCSSGWTNNRNVTQLLEFMVRRGEVTVAGRAGTERLWDLAERVDPTSRSCPLMKLSGAATHAAWHRSASPAHAALVGKLDASADRQAGVLRVNSIHWDVDTNRAMVAAVDREIEDLAAWLNLESDRTS